MINAQFENRESKTFLGSGVGKMKKGFLEDSQIVSVKMSRSTRDKLRNTSKEKGSTLSKTIRSLIYQHLENQEAIAP